MNIISLPVEYDKKKIDSKFRIVAIASQRAKELALGVKPKIKTKWRKPTSIALEETLEYMLEFLVGGEAVVAKEEAKGFDYRKLLEARKRETMPEDLSELEKDLRVYLHEKEEAGKKAIEEIFGEKQQKSAEDSEK